LAHDPEPDAVTIIVDQDTVLAGLTDVWGRLDLLLAGLSDDEWARPTPLPGWSVKDVVVHMIGTESMLLGDATPSVDIGAAPHVRNDIGRLNEAWVVSMADRPPADVLATFRGQTTRRLDSLREMDAATWQAEGFTPAGNDSYGRFMRIRVFDCWLHEQDIRDGVSRPGGDVGTSVELALDEAATVMGFVVGKRAAAPPGSRVAFDLTGPTARRIFVEVDTGERPRATVVDELSAPPTVALWMPTGVFVRLAGGRVDPSTVRGQIDVEGDPELGERLIANLAFTI
jgi:uncharacterized protein (TIGR03083 family)